MGRLESHRTVAHMTSSDDIIFLSLSDGLLDSEGNYRNCEEPLHSRLCSCILFVVGCAVLLAAANAPGAAADCSAHAGVLGETSTGECSFS